MNPGSQLLKTGEKSHYGELLKVVKGEGLLKRNVRFYAFLFAAVSLLSLTTWVGIYLLGYFFPDSIAWQLFALIPAVFLGALSTQYSFIGHELAHNQVFTKNKWNDRIGLVVANLFAGLSYGFWLAKHNRHHGKPNMIDGDPDINLRILAFSTEQKYQKPATERLFTSHQGWLFPILPFLTAGDLLLDSVKSVARNEGRGSQRRFFELAFLVVRFATPIILLFLFLHPIVASISWFVYMGSFGFFMGNAFAVNHIGMPLVEKGSRIGFLERQVLTSRNIKPNWLMDILMGGLNYQVEHHLFPSMARPNLKKVRPLVKSFCEERGILYTETSFVKGYGAVIRYLNNVGYSTRADPFICPLVASMRPTP